MVNFVNLADIYGAVDRGRANDIAMENARMQNQQNQRIFAQQDREIADKEKVRSIYRESGGDLKTVRDRLYGEGYASEAMGIDKQLGEQRKQNSDISKTDLENASKKIDLMGRGMKFVLDNPTKQNALQAFGALRQTGVITEDEFNNYTAKLPDDPAMIKNGAEVLFRSALDAKEQLSKFETRDTGGNVMTQAIDPITGQVKTVSTLNKTQSPDSIASNARMAAEGAANRAVTMRGQNLTDARAKEKNSIDKAAGGYSNKPIPATALKMQNEGLDKLSIASNNNAKLGQVLNQIETGALKLGLASNVEGKARNYLGISNESSRNLSSFKSTLEKLRNDSLRLNTGVQTDGDAQRAWNELFENINDQDLVKQRLKEIQEINKRGADLQKLQVENIRSNYNAPPVDFEKYEVKTPAGGGGGNSLKRDVRSEADKILGL
jgi:hypothetical protein